MCINWGVYAYRLGVWLAVAFIIGQISPTCGSLRGVARYVGWLASRSATLSSHKRACGTRVGLWHAEVGRE